MASQDEVQSFRLSSDDESDDGRSRGKASITRSRVEEIKLVPAARETRERRSSSSAAAWAIADGSPVRASADHTSYEQGRRFQFSDSDSDSDSDSGSDPDLGPTTTEVLPAGRRRSSSGLAAKWVEGPIDGGPAGDSVERLGPVKSEAKPSRRPSRDRKDEGDDREQREQREQRERKQQRDRQDAAWWEAEEEERRRQQRQQQREEAAAARQRDEAKAEEERRIYEEPQPTEEEEKHQRTDDSPIPARERHAAGGPDTDAEDEEEEKEAMFAAAGSGSISALLIAPARANRPTDLFQCVIIREKGGLNRLHPVYNLYFQDQNKLIMTARKQTSNRTPNYHIFDMSRGIVGSKLSKKHGNFLGKLRSNFSKTENTLYGCRSGKEEFMGLLFDKPRLVEQVKEGSQPRRILMVVPGLTDDNSPAAVPADDGRESLMQRLKSGRTGGLHTFHSKEPTFEQGNYRLNFHGRVTVPSVKNFQLVRPDVVDDVVMQFGKVSEDRFHLDFKAPFTVFQAFACALAQFNF